jgi:hypothetical protein
MYVQYSNKYIKGHRDPYAKSLSPRMGVKRLAGGWATARLDMISYMYHSRNQMVIHIVALTDFASRSLPTKVNLKKKSGGRNTRR